MLQVVGVNQGDGRMDVMVSKRVEPHMRFKNALFFYNKQGFSDQQHHSSTN